MPSSFGSFKFQHDAPTDPKTKQKIPLPHATDLHFTNAGKGQEKHKVLGLGDAPGKLKSPSDPNATFNVQGQDTTTIDITNIDVTEGTYLILRIESQSSTGELPTLTATWTYPPEKEKLVVGTPFPVKAIGTPVGGGG